MSLVYAGIIPHSPLLVPSIGREHHEQLSKTIGAIERIEKELYASFPETILIISPHGPVETEHFTLDLNKKYVCSLKEFGDFDTSIDCGPDMQLINDLKELLEDLEIPFMLRTEEVLDYGVVVPLANLTRQMKKVTIVPIYPSGMDLKTHFEFGKAIKEVIHNTNRRVAVLASADLSHKLTKNAPGGFSEMAKKFDDKIVQLISNRNSSGFINFDPELAKESGECGLTALTIFMGTLDHLQVEPEILSYEGPFGVGYLVTHYALH